MVALLFLNMPSITFTCLFSFLSVDISITNTRGGKKDREENQGFVFPLSSVEYSFLIVT